MASAKPTGPKVTIYFKAVLGIGKKEGIVQYASKHRVQFMAKGARTRASVIDSYYSPFFLVVAGWGHPEPDSMWDPAKTSTSGGVTTQHGRYTSTDPRWVDDFLSGPGKGLKPLAMLKDGVFTNPGNIPEGPEKGTAEASIRPELDDLRTLLMT